MNHLMISSILSSMPPPAGGGNWGSLTFVEEIEVQVGQTDSFRTTTITPTEIGNHILCYMAQDGTGDGTSKFDENSYSINNGATIIRLPNTDIVNESFDHITLFYINFTTTGAHSLILDPYDTFFRGHLILYKSTDLDIFYPTVRHTFGVAAGSPFDITYTPTEGDASIGLTLSDLVLTSVTGLDTEDLPILSKSGFYYAGYHENHEDDVSSVTYSSDSGGANIRNNAAIFQFPYLLPEKGSAIHVNYLGPYAVIGRIGTSMTVQSLKPYAILGRQHESVTVSTLSVYAIIDTN